MVTRPVSKLHCGSLFPAAADHTGLELIHRRQPNAMRNVVIVMIAILAAPGLALAVDVVELKSGQRVEGSFKSADEIAVRIDVGGRIVTFKPHDVHAIYYDVERAVTPPVSPATEALKVLK